MSRWDTTEYASWMPMGLGVLGWKRLHLSAVEHRASLVIPRIADELLQSISENDQVCVLSVTATDVLREAQRRQNTTKAATAALGRTVMAALLLQVVEASAETVQLTMSANGALGNITAVGSGPGVVKGFVEKPNMEVPFKLGKLNTALAVGGTGKLTIILKNKAWAKWKVRSVPIYKGEVAEGIGRYLIRARQLHTMSSFGVSFDRAGGITCARGFVFQALQDVSRDTLVRMEENIKQLPSMSENSDYDARKIAEHLLEGIGIAEVIKMPTPRFGPCGAELRETVRRTSVGEDMPFYEIKQILQTRGFIEVWCEACMERFQYGQEELQEFMGQGVSDAEEELEVT